MAGARPSRGMPCDTHGAPSTRATCGRHDLRAPVRQFLRAIASCAWPVTAPCAPLPALLPSDIARLRPRTRAFYVAGRGLLPPRPPNRRVLTRVGTADRHVPFPHPNEALMQTRTSVPSTSVPRPGPRPCSGKHGRPTWTSAANGIGWAWATIFNGWPSMAAPSSPILAAAAAASWTWRTSPPGLGAAHDHRHAGPVRRDQARARIHELADLAQKFGTLSYPSNAAGFYFPVEIDPTTPPRPPTSAPSGRSCRAYTCRSTTAPASTTRPPRNGWTHSSPGRDHPVPGRRGRTRRDAAAGAGPLRPDPRATPEDRDDRRGLPSESHARRRLSFPPRRPDTKRSCRLCAPGSGARLRRPPTTWTQR